MSWTISLPQTPREEFDAAVDAAEAGGQDASLPGVSEDVAAAKAALKELAKRVKRPVIGGYANGHSLQADEGDNWVDAVSVGVHGVSEVAKA